jgi:hypothetical protein
MTEIGNVGPAYRPRWAVAEEAAEMVAEVARVAEVAVAKQKLSEARRFGIAKDIFMFLIDCPENILHSETTA